MLPRRTTSSSTPCSRSPPTSSSSAARGAAEGLAAPQGAARRAQMGAALGRQLARPRAPRHPRLQRRRRRERPRADVPHCVVNEGLRLFLGVRVASPAPARSSRTATRRWRPEGLHPHEHRARPPAATLESVSQLVRPSSRRAGVARGGGPLPIRVRPGAKRRTSAGALPGGVSAFLRASDAVDAARAPPPTAVLRWTWHEPHPPAGTKGDAGDEGRFLPARLKNETNETNAQTADRRLVGTAELERVIDANATRTRTSCSIIRTETERPMLPRQTQTLRTLRTNDDLLQHVASLSWRVCTAQRDPSFSGSPPRARSRRGAFGRRRARAPS